MAMTVTYETFDGVLLSEKRGGTVTEYFGDPLGSLVRTEDSTGAATSTATFWPYGEQRSSTGSNPSPWGFVGLLGYFTDMVSRLYVRMRYYRPETTAWMTVDPVWPGDSAYTYGIQLPVVYADPSGLQVKPSLPISPNGPVSCTPQWNSFIAKYCTACYALDRPGLCQTFCDSYASQYYAACKKPYRIPRPGEHWVPVPGPGDGIVVPISPYRGPSIVDYPCGPSPDDCRDKISKPCLTKDSRGNDVATGSYAPDPGSAIACCYTIPVGGKCGNKRQECLRLVAGASALIGQAIINNFGGSRGSSGAGPGPKDGPQW